jgi:hypothetical protein
MPLGFLTSGISWPHWSGERYKRLDVLQRFLDGTIYNHLRYAFHEEADGAGTYIPLRERRPSVQFNVCRVVVNRSTRMVFGGNKWPKLVSTDKTINTYLEHIVDTTLLKVSMLEAAFVGSIGSVLVLFSFVNGKLFYEIRNSKFCSPRSDNERELDEVLIVYPVFGYDLFAIGYAINDEDLQEEFFYAKRVKKDEEIVYKPIRVEEYEGPSSLVKDSARSTTHNLGFVPGVWIRNLYPTDGLDGESTFGGILSANIEIDYQLSQCGRGLKYSADPQLCIKEPPNLPNEAQQMSLFGATSGMSVVRSASNAIFVSGDGGDAKLLEISGQGQKAALEFVDKLHRYALEAASSSHKDPDRAYGNMSGRAMEILDEDLIALSGALRLTYGDSGLKPLLLKIVRAATKLGILRGVDVEDEDFALQLYWGNWFDPTPTDLSQTETALQAAVNGRRIFMHEARMLSAENWGVGHADPNKLEDQWELPPEPEPLPDVKAKLAVQKAKMNGAGGDDGRDAKVLG